MLTWTAYTERWGGGGGGDGGDHSPPPSFLTLIIDL